MGLDDIKESLDKQLFSQTSPDRFVHYLDYWKEHKKDLTASRKLMTGFNQLDSLLDGFHGGELVVITGPTGGGKTLFADSIGQRIMRLKTEKLNGDIERTNIGWLSYEVPTIQMIEKYQKANDAQELGLYVPMELKTGDFEWLKTKCLEARVRHECKAIFIDHLHFLVDMDTKLNMSLNIGAVMRQIKQDIAVRMGLVVFLIAHQGQKKDQEPSLDNIRDSSFIAQESDIVMVVYRKHDPIPTELQNNAKIPGYELSYEQGLAIVKIEKARRTGVFKKRIEYQKKDFWLEECL